MSRAWRFYLGFYANSKLSITLAMMLSLAQAALTLPIALLLSRLFNSVPTQADSWKIDVAAFALISLYMLGDAALMGVAQINLRVTKNVILSLREQVIAAVYRHPLRADPQSETGWLHGAIVQDTERVDVMSNSLLSRIIPSALSATGILLILVGLSWRLFCVACLLLPMSFLASLLFNRPVRRRIDRFQGAFERFSTDTIATLQRRDLAIAQNAELSELARLNRHARDIRDAGHEVAWITTVAGLVQGEAAFLTGILVLLAGLFLVATGNVTVGTLLAFYFAMGFVRSNLTVLFGQTSALIAGLLALDRLYSMLRSECPVTYSGTEPIVFRGDVTVSDVCVAYDAPLLANATMAVRPGELTAVFGPSGVGKTTLVNLILGLTRPKAGRILADGRPYEGIDLAMMRTRIGYAQQNPVIFAATVRDNLTFGATDSELNFREALEIANATDFVGQLPHGLETWLGENGVRLSGGQRQRLSFARAVLRRPALLILDEPTNHLGAAEVTLFLKRFRARYAGASILVISHDAEILEVADTRYLVKDGTISCAP